MSGSLEDAIVFSMVRLISERAPFVWFEKEFEEAEQQQVLDRLVPVEASLRLVNHNRVLERCFIDG